LTELAIRDRVIVVTGGTGFVGSHLVRALSVCGPAEIRVLGRSTPRVAALVRHIRGEIDDRSVVAAAVRGAHVVFHLAAMKNVVDCEMNPDAAARVNVEGARVLVECVLHEPGVERFVAVSSTSAVLARNVYGKTKALMERIVLDAQGSSSCSFVIVRLGNVWGTPGSVVDRWLQVPSTGVIDVTDPDMTRFAMTIEEAVELLVAASATPHRGTVVSTQMPSYRLGDLADAVSRRTGRPINVVGARPGEDTHEHLLAPAERPFAERAGALLVVGDRPVPHAFLPPSSEAAPHMTGDELERVLTRLEASRVAG
jgi:UDP-N-acetylglucosamine 4,6-dehydratase/5-epimerase